jgi:hypothetical protein
MIRRLTARDARLSSFRLYDLLVHIFVYDRGANFNPFARALGT